MPTASSRSPGRLSRLASSNALVGAVIFAAAVGIFSGTTSFEFLDWDDHGYVVDNRFVQSFSVRSLRHFFTQPVVKNYVPLQLISYQLDFAIWGLDPFGFHLDSVLLHGVNSLLVWMFVLRLTGRRDVSFLSGALFAVHPCHVESVAWVSGRKDLLAFGFGVSSVLAYMRAREGPDRARCFQALSFLLFVLGVLSKVTIAVLPAFLLLLDLTATDRPHRRLGAAARRLLPDKIPYLVVGALVGIQNVRVQVTARAHGDDAIGYVLIKAHALSSYLGLLSGAQRGQPTYDLPSLDSGPALASSLAGLAVAGFSIWASYRCRDRLVRVSIGWIYLNLLPALAFPLVTYMADRYLYIPSMGFCMLLAAGVCAVAARCGGARTRVGAACGIALAILVFFAFRTLQYLPVWRSTDTLWTYTAERTTGSLARIGLAAVRLDQGRYGEAEALLESVPPSFGVYTRLAPLYASQARYLEALAAYDRAIFAIEELPDRPNRRRILASLHVDRAIVLVELSRLDSALVALREARRIWRSQPRAEELEKEVMRLLRARDPGHSERSIPKALR